jgi:chromosome transmission fidelity protein 1
MHSKAATLTTFLQGKTASLLSATISWLLDDHERAKKGYLSRPATNDRTCPLKSHIQMLSQPWDTANDWVAAQTLDRQRRELETEEAEYRERLLRARRREEAMKRIASGRVAKRQVRSPALKSYRKVPDLRKKLTHPGGNHLPDEDTFLPDDFTDHGFEDNVDPKVKALMQR